MKIKCASFSNCLILIESAFIMAWLSNLIKTDAMYCIYALCGIAGIFSLCFTHHYDMDMKKAEFVVVFFSSVFFSFLVILANYAVFSPLNDLIVLFNLICSFIGGIIVALNILCCILYYISKNNFHAVQVHDSRRTLHVFFVSWCSIVLINLIHLYFVEYPGNLTNDSLTQLRQIISGEYTNHHPYWHTMIIKCCFAFGNFLFHDYNSAVTLYAVWQILFMAACFSYAISTLFHIGVPVKWIVLVWCIFALMPYNIAYSICMGKDVPFSGAVLVLIVSLYRILKNLGNKKVSYILFAVSGLGMCIWRSNGILAFALTGLLYVPFFWKRNRTVLFLMLGALISGWLLTGPYLSLINVRQTDLVESLSIPVQQVTRVIYDNCELTEEESALIGQVIDIDEVPELYVDWLSDPMKDEIRSKNNGFFEEHISDYAALWVRLGMRYPGEYVKAWVDQTKGYWNAGYDYNPYSLGVSSNTLGITEGANNNLIAKVSHGLFKLSRGMIFMDPFESVGLHVWLIGVLLVVNLLKGRPEHLLSVPILAIILTLLVATPVSYAFRYAYAVFTTYPFISMVSVFNYKEN